jgi:hypothetical protein
MQEETMEAVGVPARVLPFVKAESVEGRAPVVVLGAHVVKTRLRGGLAVIETDSGVTVMADARAARLLCIALGVALVR